MKRFLIKTISTLLMSNNPTNPSGKDDKKTSFIMRLIDDDNNFSTANFFLVAMTIVGIVLLLVPVAGMIVDIFFNHTITINLSDLGTYILAVSGIFGVAGLSNAWVEYSWNKYNSNIFAKENKDDCGCE